MLSFTAVFNNPLDSFERHGISVGSFEGRVEQHINLASALPRTEVKKKTKELICNLSNLVLVRDCTESCALQTENTCLPDKEVYNI